MRSAIRKSRNHTPLRWDCPNGVPRRGGRGLTHRHPPPPDEGPASPQAGPSAFQRLSTRTPPAGTRTSPTWTAVPGNGSSPVDPQSGNGWENQALFGSDDRLPPAADELRP
jgi:hypothetical protein